MLWIFVGGAVAAFLWMFGATWRTLFRSFTPSRRSDAAAFWGQHSSSHG
jgi:hypothetical protein